MRKLRPSVLPDNRKLVLYPLVVGLSVAGTGVVLGNPVVIVLPLIILAVFPGLPALFHFIYHFFVEYRIFGDRLIVIDRVSDPSVRSRGRREIEFGSIAYCFYVDQEARLMTNLLTKLKTLQRARDGDRLSERKSAGQIPHPRRKIPDDAKGAASSATIVLPSDPLSSSDRKDTDG